MAKTNYKCCKCEERFQAEDYNFHYWSTKNVSVTCSECGEILVADYDYVRIEKSSNLFIYVLMCYLVILGMLYIIFGWSTGVEIYSGVGLVVPGIVAVFNDHLISLAPQGIIKTRQKNT